MATHGALYMSYGLCRWYVPVIACTVTCVGHHTRALTLNPTPKPHPTGCSLAMHRLVWQMPWRRGYGPCLRQVCADEAEGRWKPYLQPYADEAEC